jgi:hypothetical protein
MTGYPLMDVFLSILFFCCWVLWLMLLFWIVWDIFGSRDLGGWAKAGWLACVVLLPLLGVLMYLIARGGSMDERQFRQARGASAGSGGYTGAAHATNGHSQSDELVKLAGLHQRGIINDEEFKRAKDRVLV